MSAPPSSVASTQVTDGPAAEQAVGPAADGRKKLSLDSASSSGDEATIAQPNAPLPPQSDPLPAQMAAKASTPLAPARPAEKFALNRLDTPALASQDNPRFADAVVASQTQPAQPTTIGETSVPPAVAPTISANTAMAEANRAVALRVSRAIASGEDTLTIELHPAELGHVAVHLAFHGSSVEVQMVVGRQETFQAFTQDRAALEQQFSQAGIDLGAGGLDLRYSRTPEPKQGYASGPSQSEAGFVEPQASKVFSTDNLVNIVA